MALALRTRVEERRAYWLFSLPAFILYLFVFAFPIVLSLILSLSNYSGGQMFGGEPWGLTGFQQYAKLFEDPSFWQALKNNIYIVLVSVLGQLPLGFIFAYLIYRKIVKFGEFWQGVLYVPAIISVIVLGIMWKVIFNSDGILADAINHMNQSGFVNALQGYVHMGANGVAIDDNLIAKVISIADPDKLAMVGSDPTAGLKEYLAGSTYPDVNSFVEEMKNLFATTWTPTFLAKQDVAMLPIMFVTLWCWTGMYLILFLANMQKIDSEVIEAAKIDGANEFQVLWHIVFPSLSGVIVNSAILCIAGSMNTFALIWAMTSGGPMNVTEVMSIYMYRVAFVGRPDYPLANTIAMVIVAFSFVLIGLTKLVEKRFGGKD